MKKYNVKATFFVTNNGSDDVIKREYNEGHTVALHTATHQYSIYQSTDTYFNDLNIVKDRVKRVTGYDAKYIRFPGGSSNTISKKYNVGIMSVLTKQVEEQGYRYFDWNVSVEDAGSCATKKVVDKNSCVVNNFKNYLKPNQNNIVLLHDIKSYTAQSLGAMIQYGLDKGYTFKVINDDTPDCHHSVNN